MDRVRVAVIGLGFGGEFVPIYQAWDKTECAAVCRRDEKKLHAFADKFDIPGRYTSYDALLKDPSIHAVHINSPVNDHASMAIAALKAGKHVACTVPMALTVEECLEIARLEKETGKVYMMMETAIYTREYLLVKNMYERGEIGEVQFLRGSHQQNMSLPGWPAYWYGMPPMYYSTHALAPLSAIIGKRFDTVRCLGSGRIEEEYIGQYGSPYAVETATYTFEDSNVACEATRSLFRTIRQYRENFDVYGSKKSFEWEQVAGEGPIIFSGFEDARRAAVPDTDGILPGDIGKFALKEHIVDESQLSFIQGSDHGGSHPHVVHEFINAILQGRPSQVNADIAANWTMAGILAHQSAVEGGSIIKIPKLQKTHETVCVETKRQLRHTEQAP